MSTVSPPSAVYGPCGRFAVHFLPHSEEDIDRLVTWIDTDLRTRWKTKAFGNHEYMEVAYKYYEQEWASFQETAADNPPMPYTPPVEAESFDLESRYCKLTVWDCAGHCLASCNELLSQLPQLQLCVAVSVVVAYHVDFADEQGVLKPIAGKQFYGHAAIVIPYWSSQHECRKVLFLDVTNIRRTVRLHLNAWVPIQNGDGPKWQYVRYDGNRTVQYVIETAQPAVGSWCFLLSAQGASDLPLD